MNNFERLQGVMPFAVMLYLMMTLAQLHRTQMFWRRAVSTWPGAGSFALATSFCDFRQEVGRIADADKRIVLLRDPVNYTLGRFVPP